MNEKQEKFTHHLAEVLGRANSIIEGVHSLPTINVVIVQTDKGTVVDLMSEGASNELLSASSDGTSEWEFLDDIPTGGLKIGQAVIVTGKMLPCAKMVTVGKEIVRLGKDISDGGYSN